MLRTPLSSRGSCCRTQGVACLPALCLPPLHPVHASVVATCACSVYANCSACLITHLPTCPPACLPACRCPGCPGASKGAVVTAWAAEMASFLKCLDPNHLVSVAQPGWYVHTAWLARISLRLPCDCPAGARVTVVGAHLSIAQATNQPINRPPYPCLT